MCGNTPIVPRIYTSSFHYSTNVRIKMAVITTIQSTLFFAVILLFLTPLIQCAAIRNKVASHQEEQKPNQDDDDILSNGKFVALKGDSDILNINNNNHEIGGDNFNALRNDVSNEKESLKDTSNEQENHVNGLEIQDKTFNKNIDPGRKKTSDLKHELEQKVSLLKLSNEFDIKSLQPRHGKISPVNPKQQGRSIYDDMKLDSVGREEEGAGESILRFGIPIDQPLQHKPLPIVKAHNKIDAIVKVRQSAEDDRYLRAKFKLGIDDIEPQDHLEGVRMEQDGHLNRDYKKEIFLGNHEAMENLSEEETKNKLMQIFKKVDRNRNKYITVDELEDWIISKVEEHFREAKEENRHVFKSIDTDHDNYIKWREFHMQFLMGLGLDERSALNNAMDIGPVGMDDEESEAEQAFPLEAEDKERLVRFRLKWSEADTDGDNLLSLDEFQAFRHPEQSKAMLNNMVDDIMDNLDKNQNAVVSEREFVALPPAGLGHELHEADRQWQAERKKEFRNVIDTNHDGKLTKQELLSYVDPQNPNHAKLEARNLIDLGDENHDERLSLKEVLDNVELFMGSKMVDTGASFHDEF